MKQTVFLILVILLVSCAAYRHKETVKKSQPYKLDSILQKTAVQQYKEEGEALPEDATDEQKQEQADRIKNQSPSSIVIERLPIDQPTEDYEYTSICQIKQGFIAMLDDYHGIAYDDITTDKSIKRENILHAKEVFAVLNEDTLSIFENQNANSLIKTVNVRRIDLPVVVNVWDKYHCFQLVENDEATAQERLLPDKTLEMGNGKQVDFPLPNALVTLCTGSELAKKDWVSAIALFEGCSVVNPDNKDDNIDPMQVNVPGKHSSSSSSSTKKKFIFYKDTSGSWRRRVITTTEEKTIVSSSSSTKSEMSMIKKLKIKQKEYERRKMEETLSISEQQELMMIRSQIDKLTKFIFQQNSAQTEAERIAIRTQQAYLVRMDKLKQAQECDTEKQEVIAQRRQEDYFAKLEANAQKADAGVLSKTLEQFKKAKDAELAKIKAASEAELGTIKIASDKLQQQLTDLAVRRNVNIPEDQECRALTQANYGARCNSWYAQGTTDRGLEVEDYQSCQSQPDSKLAICKACCTSYHGSEHAPEQEDCINACTDSWGGAPAEFRFKQHHTHRRHRKFYRR